MTGPEDTRGSTRPISVAELLAKNGTIGSPPVGGRRRRRRGGDSVTVAELTGEIPVVADESEDEPEASGRTLAEDEKAESAASNGAPAAEPEVAEAVADYDAHLRTRDARPQPLEFQPHRPHYAHALRRPRPPVPAPAEQAAGGAEQMSPDPVGSDLVDDLDHDLDGQDMLDSPVDLVERPEADYGDDDRAAGDRDAGDDELPSYLRATEGPLFGGQTVADDLARRGLEDSADVDEHDDLDDDTDLDVAEVTESKPMHGAMRAAVAVGQCILAVAFGAGLFAAFDQLWKWNYIVALVLSVLVILGLVVAVRVVRKTEDIGSTLIAVAVGALVTLGPLALLQSG